MSKLGSDWDYLLSTPGASSEDLSKFPSRQYKYKPMSEGELIKKLEATKTVITRLGAAKMIVDELVKHETSYEGEWINEEEEMDSEQKQLKVLAQKLTEAFRQISEQNDANGVPKPSFALKGPLAATVLKAKGYSKAPLIGGETFRVGEFYLGKRGEIIATFLPDAYCDFERLELPLEQALDVLHGFEAATHEDVMDKIYGVNYSGSLRCALADIKASKTKVIRAKELEDKSTQYDGGFGSW